MFYHVAQAGCQNLYMNAEFTTMPTLSFRNAGNKALTH